MTLTSPFLRKYGRYLFLFGTAAAIVAADRWTKKVAVRHLAVRTQGMAPPPCNERGPVQERVRYRAKPPVTVIPSFFDLRYSENCGGAWGLLGAANEKVRYPFFIGITILAIGFIVYLYRGLGREQRLLMAALPLVLGGAFGNFIDRLDSRYVVEWRMDGREARWQSMQGKPAFKNLKRLDMRPGA